MTPEPLYEKVMRRTIPDGECIVFTGSRSKKGYGSVYRGEGRMRMMRTHRVVWEHHQGPIPTGMLVCHTCDNPPCVNIDHLWLGTPAANMADMWAKGRFVSGQAAKTHCPKGHPYDEKNTSRYYRASDGVICRQCRECRRLRWAARKAALRGDDA